MNYIQVKTSMCDVVYANVDRITLVCENPRTHGAIISLGNDIIETMASPEEIMKMINFFDADSP